MGSSLETRILLEEEMISIGEAERIVYYRRVMDQVVAQK